MIKDIETAKEVNQRIREACRILDESAALVRTKAIGGAPEYVIAIARVFDAISAELLEPLYKEHLRLAPAEWKTEDGKV